MGNGDHIKNPLEALLGYQLRRASATNMAEVSAVLLENGLRVSEASALLLIKANPGITQSEIGRELGIHRANMVPLIGALEKAGLIDRQQADGRSQGLRVTAAGSEAAQKAVSAMQGHDEAMLHGASPEDREAVRRALAVLWRSARN